MLKRNPFYRGARPANVDQVVETIGESREACLLAVEQDRIDYCVDFSIPPTAYRELAERYGINRTDGRVFVSPKLGTWYLAFNHDRPAFKGPGQIPLKKAINYAIDRPALLRTSATSRASAPTKCCRPCSPAPRASTRSAERTSPRRGAGTRGHE